MSTLSFIVCSDVSESQKDVSYARECYRSATVRELDG
jgi:hypothetical protein